MTSQVPGYELVPAAPRPVPAEPVPAPGSDPDQDALLRIIDTALDKAMAIPAGAVRTHVARVRRSNPEASPAQVVRILEKHFLRAVSASGGAVGAAAVVPGVGTGVGVVLTTSEIVTFFSASTAFTLAVAEVHGIPTQDQERRRTLLLSTILGEPGVALAGREAGLTGAAWAQAAMTRLPLGTVKRVNRALTRRLVQRWAVRQGSIAAGRLIPLGVGALIGAVGGRALGRTVVAGARTAFGPAPARFAPDPTDDAPGLAAPPRDALPPGGQAAPHVNDDSNGGSRKDPPLSA